MGVIIGVIVGYALGSKAGPDAWKELEDAWSTIRSSDEVRDLVSGAVDILSQVVKKRAEIVGGIIGSPDRAELWPVA